LKRNKLLEKLELEECKGIRGSSRGERPKSLEEGKKGERCCDPVAEEEVAILGIRFHGLGGGKKSTTDMIINERSQYGKK